MLAVKTEYARNGKAYAVLPLTPARFGIGQVVNGRYGLRIAYVKGKYVPPGFNFYTYAQRVVKLRAVAVFAEGGERVRIIYHNAHTFSNL